MNTQRYRSKQQWKPGETLFRWGMMLLLCISITALASPTVQAQDTTFAVNVVSKTSAHPYNGMGNPNGYAVNGEQGATLTLIRGVTYEFNLDGVSSFHPFYISTSASGGGSGEYTDGVTNSMASDGETLTFTPNTSTPDTLYYQCGNHTYMGYKLIIQTAASPGMMTFEGNLTGDQEVSPVLSTGSGSVTAALDAQNRLSLEGSFDDLSSEVATSVAGGAHIHQALPGQNGGVMMPLTLNLDSDNRGGALASADNTFVLSNEQVEALLNRELYVNIHSTDHTAGELRGQLMLESEQQYIANLSGSKEIPSVSSKGHGTVIAEMHTDTLVLVGSFTDLSSEISAGSHLHDTLAGSNAGVSQGLTVEASSDNRSGVYRADQNKYELSSAQKAKLESRQFYVNVHSTNHAGGELRGQLLPASKATFYTQLSGAAQPRPLDNDGSGAVAAELKADGSLVLTGSFSNLESNFNSDIGGGSHLHIAPAGSNGGVARPISATVSGDMRSGTYMATDNTFSLDSQQEATLMSREYYVNIHTEENASGSLRGQVLPQATAYFDARLTSWNQVPPFESSGNGHVIVEVRDSNIVLTGSFNGMASSFNSDVAGGSHLHMAEIGANGGVQVALHANVGSNDTSGVYAASDNSFTISAANVSSLYDSGLYLNIHSTAHASGELRGQVLPFPNKHPDSSEITMPADTASIEVSGEASSTFTAEWEAASDTNGNAIGYIYQIGSPETGVYHQTFVKGQTSAQVSFGILDSILVSNNIDIGVQDTMYHRVLTTDGSLYSASEAKVMVLTRGEIMTDITETRAVPAKTELKENYPNPFNPKTTIKYSVKEQSPVKLEVYNMLGRKVATLVDRTMNAGSYNVNFNASDLASGVYLYRLTTPNKTMTQKMTLLK